ncbi:halocarboxylic acid dehydrogenase DehI family protein [Alphaproteobacteria bacterium]|nr:halocarboxylic acid dehydrogenase DehI family protein [Alphaproteobacteria bacterium]
MNEIGDLDLPQEIYEEEAIGRTAEIYDDIRTTLQLPMVNMIYRRLAINEEALDWCWENMKPVILTGAIDRAGEQITDELFIDDAPTFPAEGLRLAGVAEDQRPAILAVIDGYNRANPRNTVLLGVLKALRLREPVAGAKVDSFNAPTTRNGGDGTLIPPMVGLTDMSPDIAATVRFMIRHRKPDAFFSVPSMYRHLANWPGALSLAAAILEPMEADGRISRAASGLTASAMALGEKIAPVGPIGVAPAPETIAGKLMDMVVDSFSRNIPELIIVGAILRQAFADDTT